MKNSNIYINFRGYDDLIDDQFQMDGVDYICFTDRDIKSKTWKVVKSTPIYNDPNRNAKKYKYYHIGI
jgi:hypothetical protein